MTRRQLADAVNKILYPDPGQAAHSAFTANYLGKLENGKIRYPAEDYRTALRIALNADTDDELGFRPARELRTTVALVRRVYSRSARHESDPAGVLPGNDMRPGQMPEHGEAGEPDTNRRSLLQGIAAVAASAGLLGGSADDGSRRVGHSDIDRLDAVISLYRSIDYERGGGALYRDVAHLADSASAMLDQPYPSSVGSRLLRSVASVRQLAGWTAFDACRHLDAQRHFLLAERMAVAANDVLLTARVRYCQARQFQHLRHNKDALETLRLARDEVGRRVTPAVSAMLHGAEAASLAALGDGPSATRALGSATDEFDRINPDNEPDWMRFYDRGELLAQYGRVYRDLARKEESDRYGEAATRTVTEAIDTLGSQNVRSSVLSSVSLCSSLFLADEPDEAVSVGARVIEQARQLSSPRILDRIHNLRRDLKRHERLSTVADFSRTVAAVGVGS
ncbi:hypothetical protein ACN27F_13440 [Solwaraspora sp. WMMB335]|uniref:hypothetical protein n=1 Tax=Solwaraspora sp. WMMB335 TaxID=3404118 RepID=UPI003B92670F